ncbi:MAG: DUF47 family protein [Thermoleophilia bacterium]|nr:DUF47 family protein [Thermoleophilia bacterium]
MTLHRWFLPSTPDVLGTLGEQVAVTRAGLEALRDWAGGDAAQADVVRDCEHRADAHKREVQELLTTAFMTPLDPEDIYSLSRGIDAILNGAKDAVREAEVMALPPDGPVAEMAALLVEGMRSLGEALELLAGRQSEGATAAADAAIKSQRRIERVYRRAMAALIEIDDLRQVMARRELYRRFARLGDGVADVAERVWYAVVKET